MSVKKPYSQAARVQGILRTLGVRHGITIGELAEEFGVTKRTLYRDLKALEEAGYPLISEITDGTTYWKLEASFRGVPPRIRVRQRKLGISEDLRCPGCSHSKLHLDLRAQIH